MTINAILKRGWRFVDNSGGREAEMGVSREAALAACEQVRDDNRRRYLSAAHWQCWGWVNRKLAGSV